MKLLELKKQDQTEWVRRMNSIRDRADEFIRHDLIYLGSWSDMPMAFKVLLAPVWLVLGLLMWTSLIASGIAFVVLRLGGMILLLISVAYLVLEFEPFLTIRMIAVEIGAFFAPYISPDAGVEENLGIMAASD